MAASYARMSDAVKAQCYAMRQPGKNKAPMTYDEIAQVVRKTDKTRPTADAVRIAVKSFTQDTALS